jgi:hypothetical protein
MVGYFDFQDQGRSEYLSVKQGSSQEYTFTTDHFHKSATVGIKTQDKVIGSNELGGLGMHSMAFAIDSGHNYLL